jgi:hypothetical protein
MAETAGVALDLGGPVRRRGEPLTQGIWLQTLGGDRMQVVVHADHRNGLGVDDARLGEGHQRGF